MAGHAAGRHLQRTQLGGVRRLRVLAPDPGRPGAGGVPRGGDDGAALRRRLPPSRAGSACTACAHRDLNPYYHNYHVGQLLALYRMTGAVAFARYADQFSADYPRPGLSTTMTVAPGRYAAVRFDGAGNVLARRTVTARRAVATRVTRRQRLVPGGDALPAGRRRSGRGLVAGRAAGQGVRGRSRRDPLLRPRPQPWRCSADAAYRAVLARQARPGRGLRGRAAGRAALAAPSAPGRPCSAVRRSASPRASKRGTGCCSRRGPGCAERGGAGGRRQARRLRPA